MRATGRQAVAGGLIALALAGPGCGGGTGGSDKDAGPPGPGPMIDLGGGVAVAYQIDVAHTGNQPASALRPPLTRKWSVDLGSSVSYPLVAGGRVFVTVAAVGKTASVQALNVATGATAWGPVTVGMNWANAAFDDGKVYVANDAGAVAAYDAASGTLRWSTPAPFPQRLGSTPPIASNGIVFGAATGTGGTLFALEGATGAVRWSAQVLNGDTSSPSLGAEGLFVGYACLQTYGFVAATGNALWHAEGGCEGGGGMTTALWGGRVWARDWAMGNVVFDATTGAQVGGFTADRIPAFLDTRVFVAAGSTLAALDATSYATLWTFTGDGTAASAPLAANGVVYVATAGGTLFAVDPATGASMWSAELGSGVESPGKTADFVFAPLTGLAAGQGVLLVPAGETLIAFQ